MVKTIDEFVKICYMPETNANLYDYEWTGNQVEITYTGPGHDLLTNWTREGDNAILLMGLVWYRKFKSRGGYMSEVEKIAGEEKPGLRIFNLLKGAMSF